MESVNVYSNNFIAFSTDSEFMLKFRHSAPVIGEDNKVENVIINETNITVSPIQLKRMIAAMKDQLDRFEKAYGEIKTEIKVTEFIANAEKK